MNLLRRNHFCYEVTPPSTGYQQVYYAPSRSALLGGLLETSLC